MDAPEEVACWYCGEFIDLQTQRSRAGRPLPAYAAIPTSVQAVPGENGDTELVYRTEGYFHDLSCLRAYLEADDRRRQYLQRVRDYAADIWGEPQLPPPALPRPYLRRFGGAMDWTDWKRTAYREAERWRLQDEAQAAGLRIGQRLAAQALVETQPRRARVLPTDEVHHPGAGTAFSYLVNW